MKLRFLVFTIALGLAAAGVLAQGIQNGALTGTVKTSQGDPLPGVSVTLTSPALQGQRTVGTGANGDYLVRGLPPGEYTVAFAMPGMTPVQRTIRVELGRETRLDVGMEVSAAQEVVKVTAEPPTPVQSTQLGGNYGNRAVDRLPIGRGLQAIALQTPGLNANTPNAGQLRIGGAFAFDNVYLLDGTDINDNLFGTANNLFIEDSIAETQVLTGGIPAEYGRFSGGVINAITKSGGNLFSGTLRADLTNTAWTQRTPFEVSRGINRPSKINTDYSATLGGPILKDYLWFFGGGRYAKTSGQTTLVESGLPFATSDNNKRYEIKLTGNLATNHTLQASYLDNSTDQVNTTFSFTMDPRGSFQRNLPNTRLAAGYSGVLSRALFAEAKYSEKKFGFRNSGGTSTDIHDSPFLTRTGPQRHYNAPYFDSNDPEDRNNREVSASLSYFLTTGKLGSHEVKLGYEWYDSYRTGGNSQSATDYVFITNFKRNPDGTPTQDSNGRFIPVFTPFPKSGFTVLNNWIPVRGARVDIVTQSAYLTDKWNVNDHLSFNLGVRFEKVKGDATGGLITVDTSRVVPRLAAAYDIKGDGRFLVKGFYGQYSGKYNEREFANNTNVGKPNLLQLAYNGPAGEGIGFGPAFDVSNYTIIGGNFPLQNVLIDPNIKSPVVDEYYFSAAAALGRGGFVQAAYVYRNYSSFFEDFIDLSTGTTTITYQGRSFGKFSNTLYSNTSALKRRYSALQMQARYAITPRWRVDANWTHEFKNNGNVEGEATNQPGNPSLFGDYPEIFVPSRNYPDGRLSGFQKDRVLLFNTYTLSLGRAGNLDLGLVYGYNSPLTFSYTVGGVPLSAEQKARTPAAYPRPPTSQELFFGERGAGQFESVHTLDAALTYGIPVWKGIEPWLKVQVRNALNSHALVRFDTTISADTKGPKDADGLPTQFVKGARFGQATSEGNYQTPRTFLVSAGIRF